METGVKNDTLFICVYKKFYRIILDYIQIRIKDEDEAKDLAQDVFVKVLEYKEMLREDTVKSFLFTIARNVLIDYIRRFYRKKGMDYWLAQEIQASRNNI